MIPHDKSIISTAELAKELEISKPTLWRWTVPASSPWRACKTGRVRFSVPKLRAAGLIPASDKQSARTIAHGEGDPLRHCLAEIKASIANYLRVTSQESHQPRTLENP